MTGVKLIITLLVGFPRVRNETYSIRRDNGRLNGRGRGRRRQKTIEQRREERSYGFVRPFTREAEIYLVEFLSGGYTHIEF